MDGQPWEGKAKVLLLSFIGLTLVSLVVAVIVIIVNS